MSAVDAKLIDQLLTPEVMSAVNPALASLGIEPQGREQFSEGIAWIHIFGSTAGPFGGVGCAAITNFRMTAVHSPAAMILFANNERYDQARLYGFAPFDAGALQGQDWRAFIPVSGH